MDGTLYGITIIPKHHSASASDFSINERIWYLTSDDMLNEYNRLCSTFEKLGDRVKSTVIQNENFETMSENTEILMEANSKKSTLTIGYYLPPPFEKDKEYFLGLVFTNN